MKFKNKGKSLFVGFDLGGSDPNVSKVGIPVKIEPGKTGSFSVVNRSIELAVKAGILEPMDKAAKDYAKEMTK